MKKWFKNKTENTEKKKKIKPKKDAKEQTSE